MDIVAVNNRLADAGLGAGPRIAVLSALAMADDEGVVDLSQYALATLARVSLSTAGLALRAAEDAGFIRKLTEDTGRKPAKWSFKRLRGLS